MKQDWRNDARALEELCPEEFGPPAERLANAAKDLTEPSPDSTSAKDDLSLGEVRVPAGEIEKSVPEIPPALVQIPDAPLPAGTWQTVLHGSRDALLSARDATRAVRLVAERLRKDSSEVEFSEASGLARYAKY